MRVVCISDTHMMHAEMAVPEGDVLIHAGDLTMGGSPKEIFKAVAWLAKQPHGRIILVPGNHDFGFQERPSLVGVLRFQFPRVEILIDEDTHIGEHRVYGSPWQPWFHDWAYNFSPIHGEEEAREKWSSIPEDVGILITHGPPHGILDETQDCEHVGCPMLLERLASLPKLRLHVFGHIHEGWGAKLVGDVLHVNASSCDSNYWPSQAPLVVDVDDKGRVRRLP